MPTPKLSQGSSSEPRRTHLETFIGHRFRWKLYCQGARLSVIPLMLEGALLPVITGSLAGIANLPTWVAAWAAHTPSRHSMQSLTTELASQYPITYTSGETVRPHLNPIHTYHALPHFGVLKTMPETKGWV